MLLNGAFERKSHLGWNALPLPPFRSGLKRIGVLGSPQTRQIVIDNFLVVDNKQLSMTKHLVCELSYRL